MRIIALLSVLLFIQLSFAAYPVVIFHGIGDFCANPLGMMELTKEFRTKVGSYTKCVEIGDGSISSWLMPINKQVETACNNIRKDPMLTGPISIVGLSQGGLIARGVAE